ncbi:MAG: hypothetical protein M9951_16395 [Burkholderiaceae bacterium]|nr:endonuclease/exonuclease/phosphatase family protein [Gemmatimonadales bacterium]MCO5121198.1 hypothetical protein [Burkholderiaceae bacterium]MEB2317895.1 hypothetical protein [Pseudomonadota bacterium]
MNSSDRLRIASLNTLNLRMPGRAIYQDAGYSPEEFEAKSAWLAGMIDTLASQLVGLQEVFDEEALRETVSRCAGPPPRWIAAPERHAGSDLPRVALLSWLDALGEVETVERIPDGFAVRLPGAPEIGLPETLHDRFSRPVLGVTIDLASSRRRPVPARVYVVHLKSRRPNRASVPGGPGEDMDDPVIEARAHMRSLLMRAAEAGGLRALLMRDLHQSRMPVIVLGDFNDHAKAATTNLVAGRMAPKNLARRDIQLYHAAALQAPNILTHRVGYTKFHLGEPDSIDHILLSEEFLREGKHAIAEVERVDYFNDHLSEPGRLASDHGAIRATLRLR